MLCDPNKDIIKHIKHTTINLFIINKIDIY